MSREALPERDLWLAIRRGLLGTCPSCGEAPLFARWLKPVAHCRHCGQDWTHQRADDFPAYLVILVVGHLLVPIVVEVNLHLGPPLLVQMLFWPLLTAVLAIALIRPAKGAVIGVQWAQRMHGFEKEGRGERQMPPEIERMALPPPRTVEAIVES